MSMSHSESSLLSAGLSHYTIGTCQQNIVTSFDLHAASVLTLSHETMNVYTLVQVTFTVYRRYIMKTIL